MENVLKLKSVDQGIKNIRIPVDLIECYFDVDKNNDKIEMFLEDSQVELLAWAEEVSKFLEKSKSEKAKDLLKRYEEYNLDFFNEIDNLHKQIKNKNYSVIKLHSQTMYRVFESIKELDGMFEEIKLQEKYGDGFKGAYND